MSEDRTTSPTPGAGDGAPTTAAAPSTAAGPAGARARTAWPTAPATASGSGSSPLTGSAGAAPARGAAAPSGAPSGARTGASTGAPTTVLPAAGRPARPSTRPDRSSGADSRSTARPASRTSQRRRARLVLQRIDAWSVFLFSLVASICLGVVLIVAVLALYAALNSLGVLSSINGLLGEVTGSGTPDEVVEPFITAGRVFSITAVLAAVDVVLLTVLATLGALLYNLCASLTGGIEVQLGERE